MFDRIAQAFNTPKLQQTGADEVIVWGTVALGFLAAACVCFLLSQTLERRR